MGRARLTSATGLCISVGSNTFAPHLIIFVFIIVIIRSDLECGGARGGYILSSCQLRHQFVKPTLWPFAETSAIFAITPIFYATTGC